VWHELNVDCTQCAGSQHCIVYFVQFAANLRSEVNLTVELNSLVISLLHGVFRVGTVLVSTMKMMKKAPLFLS